MKCQHCDKEVKNNLGLNGVGKFCSTNCRNRFKGTMKSLIEYLANDDSLMEVHDLIQELLKKEAGIMNEVKASERSRSST